MLDHGHVDLPKIEQIVSQWQYEKDTPYAGWKKEYRKLFDTSPPS